MNNNQIVCSILHLLLYQLIDDNKYSYIFGLQLLFLPKHNLYFNVIQTNYLPGLSNTEKSDNYHQNSQKQEILAAIISAKFRYSALLSAFI